MQNMTIKVETRAGAKMAVDAVVGHSLMEALRRNGLVEALCGGQAACATCHVHIDRAWMPKVGVARGQEADMLDTSLERTEDSRLSCQISITEEMNGLSLRIAQAEG